MEGMEGMDGQATFIKIRQSAFSIHKICQSHAHLTSPLSHEGGE
jgi:hypothetical protein